MSSFQFVPPSSEGDILFKTVDSSDERATIACVRQYFSWKYPTLMQLYGARKQVDDLKSLMEGVVDQPFTPAEEQYMATCVLPKFVKIPYHAIAEESTRSVISAVDSWRVKIRNLLAKQHEVDQDQDIAHFFGAFDVKTMLPTLRPKHQPRPEPSRALDDIYRAYFKSKYHNLLAGTTLASPADLLIRRIRDIFALGFEKNQKFYANFTSMIQGSGSGKSRLVKECSREFYVVYLCLRPEDSSGVPRRSSLASTLLALAKTVTTDNGTSKIDQFFAAMFHVIVSKVRTHWLPVDDHGRVSPQTFWRYLVEEDSDDFATAVQQTLSDWGDKTPKEAKEYMKDALKALDSSTFDIPTSSGFLVVLDEARSLLELCPGAKNSSLFLLLRSWINWAEFTNESFFLLLDTTSRVTNFYPTSPKDDPSARIASLGRMLHRPIFEFPFLGPWPLSSHLRTRLAEGGYDVPISVWTSVKSFNPLTDLFRFSRPMYLHTKDARNIKIGDAIVLVNEKLFGKDNDAMSFTVAVCYRYALRPYRVALQDKLLGSHGATLTAIHDDRSLDVRYLPEPLIGEALSRSMRDQLSTLLDTIIQQMTERELIRTLPSGDRGELASMVYLLHGYEAATFNAMKQQSPCSSAQSQMYSGLLPLGDWIATFAGIPLMSYEALPASHDNADVVDGNDRLVRMLSTCSLSFTGWTEAHEPVISAMLTYAYCHRTGFVCTYNEPAVDMALPLVLGPIDAARSGTWATARSSLSSSSSSSSAAAAAAAISETDLAAAMEQMTTGSSVQDQLIDSSQKALPHPTAAGAKPSTMSPRCTPLASAIVMDNTASAAVETETTDDPEGLDDLAQAMKRRFLPTSTCAGLGAVTVQVKNYEADLHMGEVFRYCRLQVDRLLDTAMIESRHVVSMLCMTGRGSVTTALLPDGAISPAPVLVFVEVGQPTLTNKSKDMKKPEPVRSEFVGVVINGFQNYLVGEEAKEKLMSLAATLSGPRNSKMLEKQFVDPDVTTQLNTICARQDARLPGDFEVPSYAPKASAKAASGTKRESKSAAAAPPSTWLSCLIDVTSEGVNRSLLVWYPGTPPMSK